ncbi:DUF3071 domain-containing protein [Bifidobacterium pullorum subsp. saeculare]|uniref:DUF3071 domain-containing protein n=1 Tax=Bifidobacterium pullorum subsp. saeculare TaxID=78257 RepID=A0A939B9N9_9BIFI|nr:septation protein SepH [Bifidobacterium pullorum]MBM6699036.1 DUF3071 domain-containing protein [Bifidobacterium pullorum subsp. saeculare]
MPQNAAQEARFDHVSESGELVFAAGNLRFAVAVDDDLERAMLAAKQIRGEQARLRQPAAVPTLPISSIQTLIRAGAEPSAVAQRYGLDEALVRRFSAAVQTERQYAIEQFLSVPAPKESRVRTVSDLIDRTLESAGIRRAGVKWNATRRGHEPWRITALFDSAGRQIKGEWSWNMHDNSVTCLNSTARKLLGEQNLGARPGVAPVPSAIQPGTFGNGLAIPVHAPTHGGSDAADTAPAQPAAPSGAAPASPGSSAASVPAATWNSPARSDATAVPSDADAQERAHETASSYDAESRSAESRGAAELSGMATAGEAVPSPAVPAAAQPTGQAEAAVGPDEAATVAMPAQPAQPRQADERRPRRRTGRSAVPSWDEILFGE